MNKNFSIYIIEYISLILVLSFFKFHNINLVFTGLFFSLVTINKNKIFKLTELYKLRKIIIREANKNISEKSEDKEIKLHSEDFDLSLVNKVEELGFIPSLEKNNNNIAA